MTLVGCSAKDSGGFTTFASGKLSNPITEISSGIFNPPYITKAVKIYGAGYSQNPDTNQYETKMANDMYVDINDEAEGLLIEGLYTPGLWFINTINNATVGFIGF